MDNSTAWVVTDPYWLQYATLNTWQRHWLAVALAISVMFSFCGNSAVSYVYSRNATVRKRNCFVIALSVVGNVCNVLYVPGVVKLILNETTFTFTECVLHGFVVGWMAITCIMLLAAVALERCIVVCKPFTATMITMRSKCLVIAFSLAYSLVISTPPLFGWSSFAPSGHRWSCTFAFVEQTTETRSYLVFMIITGFVIPCALILISYMLILRAVVQLETRKRHFSRHSPGKKYQSTRERVDCCEFADLRVNVSQGGNGSKSPSPSQHDVQASMFMENQVLPTAVDLELELSEQGVRKHKVSTRTSLLAMKKASGAQLLRLARCGSQIRPELKMSVLMLIIIVAFLVSWTPFTVMVIIAQVRPHSILPIHVTITIIFAKLFTVWNPIIYGWKEPMFRKQCSMAVQSICCRFNCNLRREIATQ